MASRNTRNIPEETLVNLVFAYLQGAPIAEMRQKLRETCHITRQDANALYQSITVTPAIRERLFALLYVPKKAQPNYQREKTLLTLLVRLHQDGYGYQHLAFLLSFIQETKYIHGWTRRIALSVMSAAGLGTWFYMNINRLTEVGRSLIHTLPRTTLRWLEKNVLLFRNIPLLGIGYTLALLLWNIYTTFYHGFSNLSQKLTTLLFSVLSKGLTLSGYVICFLAAGIATPLAGLLFVAGSAIDIAESLTSFFLIRLKPLPRHYPQTWEARADYARQDNQRRHANNTVWVNVSAAILTTATVAVWCFFPPGIPLTLACMTGLLTIGLVKKTILGHINTAYATALQTTLQTITKTMTAQTKIAPQSSAHHAIAQALPTQHPCQVSVSSLEKSSSVPYPVSLARSSATFFGENTPRIATSVHDTPRQDHATACAP